MQVRLGAQEIHRPRPAPLHHGSAEDALRLRGLQVLRHVVEVQGEDLLLLGPLLGEGLELPAQLVEAQGQKRLGTMGSAPVACRAHPREVEARGLIGEGGRRVLGVADEGESLLPPRSAATWAGLPSPSSSDLHVPRPRERAHEHAEQEHQEQDERHEEVEEELELDHRAGGGGHPLDHGLDLLEALRCGSTRKMNFFRSTPSSPKKLAMLWAKGAALAPLAARTMSRIRPGDCSTVSRGPRPPRRVADQDDVERDLQLLHQA